MHRVLALRSCRRAFTYFCSPMHELEVIFPTWCRALAEKTLYWDSPEGELCRLDSR